MQKYLCKIGIHRYVSLEMADCFTTEYTDKDWGPIKHIVWYQQCSCCGKRRVKDTYKKDTLGGTKHAGIEYARVGWVTYGRAYVGNGQSTVPSSSILTTLKGEKQNEVCVCEKG